MAEQSAKENKDASGRDNKCHLGPDPVVHLRIDNKHYYIIYANI